MPYCENCGNMVSETANFCAGCGVKIEKKSENSEIQSSTTDTLWNLEIFLEKHPPNDNDEIPCPRCLGKGDVDNADIIRLSMEDSWMPGWCLYCNGTGFTNIKKISKVSVTELIPELSLIELFRNKSNDINFDEKGQAVAEFEGKWGVINNKFEWILKPQFEELGDYMLGRSFDEKGYLTAKENDKWGFINRQGEWVVQPLFFLLGEFDKEDYCQAYTDNKFGWIDRNGNWLIDPVFDYEHVDFFDSGEIYIQFDKYNYCKIFLDDKYGFIDRKGIWRIPPKFDFLGEYDDLNYCLAKSESYYGYIDRLGKWVVPPNFDSLGTFDEINFCHAKYESKYGFIDRRGNWIIKPIFDAVGYFDNDGYAIAINTITSIGFIDRKGRLQNHPVLERNFFKSLSSFSYFENALNEKLDYPTVSQNFNNSMFYNFLYKASKKVYYTLECEKQSNKTLAFGKNFDSDYFENCIYLVYYDGTFWGNGDEGYAIVNSYNEIYLIVSSKIGTKIYQFYNFDVVTDYNVDILKSPEFNNYSDTIRSKRVNFYIHEIEPLFPGILHKKALDNLFYFLASSSADLIVISEDGFNIKHLDLELINSSKDGNTISYVSIR